MFVAATIMACRGDKDPSGQEPDTDTDGGADTATDTDTGSSGQPDCSVHIFEDITIPVRDKAELAAFVRIPEDPDCQLPTVFVYTSYDKENSRDLWFTDEGVEPLFDSRDYAFVVADWRGRYGSDEYDAGGADQNGEDGYDIVEWIAEQSFSDGHVGMYGPSALGGVQFTIAELQPPHLSAIVPIFAGPIENNYEKYMPGGVVRKEYLDAIGILYSSTTDFLEEHPTYDATWQYLEALSTPELTEVPVLHVNGFFDLHAGITLAGSQMLTGTSERRLLIGEWHHFASGGSTDWFSDMSEQELLWWDEERRIQTDALAFFDRHMAGVASDADDWAPVRYQRADEWLDSDTWPPSDSETLTLYLGDGTLQDSAPDSAEYDFPYDPEDPSPTVGGQTLLYTYSHGPDWQDEVVERDDALVFVTDELTEDVDLAGPIAATLQVSTTGDDTHLVIRVTDVHPDGSHLLLTDGIRRLGLYGGLDSLSDIEPGEVYDMPVDATNPLAWKFEAGHRIGLILTSSNYSRFERASNSGSVVYEEAEEVLEVTNTLVSGESTLTLTIEP